MVFDSFSPYSGGDAYAASQAVTTDAAWRANLVREAYSQGEMYGFANGNENYYFDLTMREFGNLEIGEPDEGGGEDTEAITNSDNVVVGHRDTTTGDLVVTYGGSSYTRSQASGEETFVSENGFVLTRRADNSYLVSTGDGASYQINEDEFQGTGTVILDGGMSVTFINGIVQQVSLIPDGAVASQSPSGGEVYSVPAAGAAPERTVTVTHAGGVDSYAYDDNGDGHVDRTIAVNITTGLITVFDGSGTPVFSYSTASGTLSTADIVFGDDGTQLLFAGLHVAADGSVRDALGNVILLSWGSSQQVAGAVDKALTYADDMARLARGNLSSFQVTVGDVSRLLGGLGEIQAAMNLSVSSNALNFLPQLIAAQGTLNALLSEAYPLATIAQRLVANGVSDADSRARAQRHFALGGTTIEGEVNRTLGTLGRTNIGPVVV